MNEMKMSEVAINECILEIRAACRRPIDEAALETMFSWMRSEFERILDRVDGKKRWADLGPRLRETGRFLGGFADFFASHTDAAAVGLEQLTQAITLVRADCTVRAERIPVAFEFCPKVPVDVRATQEFLRNVAPVPELMSRAS
jgi:hypothetical protein